MRKITFFLFGCLMGCGLLHCQHFDKVSEAELHKKLSAAKTNSVRIDMFIELATNHLELSRDVQYPKSIDSAFYFANKALALSRKIKSKNDVGRSYISLSQINQAKGNLNLSESYAKSAIALFSQLKSKGDLASAYRILMYSKENERDFNETVEIGLKSQKLYKEAGDKLMQAKMGEDIAYFMMATGRLEESLKILEETVTVYKEIKFGKVQYAYSTMCILCNQLGRNEKAVAYSQKAINAAEKYNDTSLNSVAVYNYSGLAYLAIKDYNKAFDYFKIAYSISKKYNDIGASSLFLTNMVEMLMKLRRVDEAGVFVNELKRNYDKLLPADQIEPMSCLIKYYVKLKDYTIAAKYAQKAILASKTMSADDMRQMGLYVGIIDYNFSTKRYDVAREYANRYKKLSEKAKIPRRLMEIHHMLFRIDSAENKFTSAMRNYKLEHVYKDSLLNEAKNKEIAELEIKYQTDKKEKELKQNKEKNRLLSLESSLQKSKLSKANLTKNIFLAGFLIFIVIFVLLYYNYRIKQKTNRVLESQKNEINQKNTTLQKLVTEKEWLLKEIHHRVKNNLQMVMSLLNAQSYYLKDDVAMTAIRESQHRIHSMSLIHKKLYQSDNVIAIDMKNYIQELIEYFKTTFETGSRVQFVMDVEPIELYSSQAVPIGLILNETITNSIKHAFTNREKGIISVFFKRSNNKNLQLSIKDDGEGISDEVAEKQNQSLGMKLIKGFSEDLDADLFIENNNGLIITIEFEYDATFSGDIQPT